MTGLVVLSSGWFDDFHTLFIITPSLCDYIPSLGTNRDLRRSRSGAISGMFDEEPTVHQNIASREAPYSGG